MWNGYLEQKVQVEYLFMQQVIYSILVSPQNMFTKIAITCL